jgi:hypothetical protein
MKQHRPLFEVQKVPSSSPTNIDNDPNYVSAIKDLTIMLKKHRSPREVENITTALAYFVEQAVNAPEFTIAEVRKFMRGVDMSVYTTGEP